MSTYREECPWASLDDWNLCQISVILNNQSRHKTGKHITGSIDICAVIKTLPPCKERAKQHSAFFYKRQVLKH